MIFYHFLFKNKLTAKHIQTLLITLFNSLSLGDDKKNFFFFFFGISGIRILNLLFDGKKLY